MGARPKRGGEIPFSIVTHRTHTRIYTAALRGRGWGSHRGSPPGPLRASLVAMVRAWQGALLRCVEQSIATGDLKAHTDAQQLVYEMYGLILALHHDARFLRVPGSIERAQAGFIRLLASYQNSVTSK